MPRCLSPIAFRRAVLALALCAAPAGCELLDGEVTDFGDAEAGKATLGRTALRPVRDSVRLEIVFVERPAGDPLLGETLWRDLDEVGAVDSEARSALGANGFRVGHCGASPPRPLQTLLGLTAQVVETGPHAKPKNLVGRRVSLPTDDEYEIQTGGFHAALTATIHDGDEVSTRTFETARCVLRLSAERLQDGWVQLRFTPEIHHGANQLRRVAAEEGFKLVQSQEVEPLWSQRFALNLGEREMAVVGADPNASDTLAHRFFAGETSERLQRLLVVRVVDVRRSEAVPVE